MPPIQNNPVNPTPNANPSPSTPPSAEGAHPPAEGAQPPAEGAHPPASTSGPAANLGSTTPPNQAQLNLANARDNILAQQSLIDTGVNADAVEAFHADLATARADTSTAHTDALQNIERDLGTASAYQSSTNIENLNGQNLGNMSFRQVESYFNRLQGQGLQANPRANPNAGQEGQSAKLAQQGAQAEMMRGRGEGADARGMPRRGAEGQAQPQTFRAHAFGFLAKDTNTGRPMGFIYTRNPTGSQTGRTPENPENPEAHTRDAHTSKDTADAGQRSATASHTRVPGERRLAADRANKDATENDTAEEGSSEGHEVAHRGNAENNPVIAAFMAGRHGSGEGGDDQQQSTREVVENAVVVFGASSPDDAARLRSEHTVNGAITAGTGYYVHNIGLGRGGRGQGETSGSPEENMLRGAAGVHAGPAQDMGELRRLSLCVNGEMIDMGSPHGQACFAAICSTNPEVREAAMGLVQQRQNFTTHVTANLFNINGGEPSARA